MITVYRKNNGEKIETKIGRIESLFREAFSESFGIRQEPYEKAKSMLAELKKEDLTQDFVQYMKSVGAEFLLEDICSKY